MKSLFIAVQDSVSRAWFPVARVIRDASFYRLYYTKGALNVTGFSGFGRMIDMHKQYVSEQLFPLLANRALSTSRPEYNKYISWLGLDENKHDVLDELARTGGLRGTDDIELIAEPERNIRNMFEVYFFVRGIRHMPAGSGSGLVPGDRLLMVRDIQNLYDKNAVLLRTVKPVALVGYAPHYYAEDFSRIAQSVSPEELVVTVERVNNDAPSPYRVLCKFESPWPDSFSPCVSDDFQALSQTTY